MSVFTHLPEEMQFKWLDDLFRITKPGGYAIMTFHGEPHYAALPPRAREKLDAHGFFYTDALQGNRPSTRPCVIGRVDDPARI